MVRLYPHPPHLTVAVYPRGTEIECFAQACEAVRQVGCEPEGTVYLVPRDVAFVFSSDLADRSETAGVRPERLEGLIAGGERAWRVAQAGFRHRQHGLVVVEYLHNPHEDRHPIAVSISAGALGWPEQLRGKSQRLSGRRLEKWAVKLLRAMASRCDPWYGTVDVEYSLPTPSALKAGKASLSPQVFVSRHAGTTVLEAFDEAFAETARTEWDSGWFYSGSARPTRASALLGRVAT